MISAVASLLGYGVLLLTLGCVASTLYKFFLRPGKNLKKYGKWAVVTGATDGIGQAIAFQLARQGLDLVLVSRTQAKLDQTASDIKAKYPAVTVKTLSVDFSKAADVRTVAARELADLEVGVLVNNVGESYSHPEFFSALPDEKVESLLALNIESVTWMTRAVLPGMESRKRGLIVNISSASAGFPSPLLSYYAATKAFVDQFSKSLAVEVAGKGVHVQVQSPLFVATKLAKIRKASLFQPSATTYARVAVKAFGYDSAISPYFPHALQLTAMSLMPSFVANVYVLKLHLGLRKRALAKKTQA